MPKPLRQLRGVPASNFNWQRSTLVQYSSEVGAGHELHRIVEPAVVDVGVQSVNDVWMPDRPEGADFAQESLDRGRLARTLPPNYLDGGDRPELPVSAAEYPTHSAFADRFEQNVGAEKQIFSASQRARAWLGME